MTGDDGDREPRPVDPALADMLRRAIRAKARFIASGMAFAVGSFAWLARDSGQPMGLVIVIGFFGAVLIAFFIALVWFGLRFLKTSRGRG